MCSGSSLHVDCILPFVFFSVDNAVYEDSICSMYIFCFLIISKCVSALLLFVFGAWVVCQVVRLYNGVGIVVMSGDVVCCSVVCGTLMGVSVFSIMCSDLLVMSEIS